MRNAKTELLCASYILSLPSLAIHLDTLLSPCGDQRDCRTGHRSSRSSSGLHLVHISRRLTLIEHFSLEIPREPSSRPQPQYWTNVLHPWVQGMYPVLGRGLAGEHNSSSTRIGRKLVCQLQMRPPVHGSRKYREIKIQIASCQLGGQEVAGR